MLIPDMVGRVWVIAETCAACAAAVPRGKLLNGGWPSSSKEAAPPEKPKVAQKRPVPAARAEASARERALNCPICKEEETQARGEDETDADTAAFGPAPAGWSPPLVYRRYAEDLLGYLDDVLVGPTPETRLLAMACALRLRPNGTFNLVNDDLGEQRLSLPWQTLADLIKSGWLETSLRDVKAADKGAPAAVCRIPSLTNDPGAIGVPNNARSRVNGWMQRAVTHQLLTGQPAGIRLAAFYVTSRCGPAGEAVISTRDMTALCCLSSRSLAVPVLLRLLELGWLAKVEPETHPGRPVRVLASSQILNLVPGTSSGQTARPTPINLQEQGFKVAQWVDRYVACHGHGPRLRELFRAHCVENPAAPWTDAQLQEELRGLASRGWLHIDNNRWYRIRPGQKYLRRRAQHQAALRPARISHPVPSRKGPAVGPQVSHGVLSFGEQDTLIEVTDISSSCSPKVTHNPTRRESTALPRGLWTIPGAEAILGPPPPLPPNGTES
ncbi:hypothetical protein ABZ547_34095 [Streptomyces sparsogenes]|uniref:hypothetical protein n=1 Tax=Streptomyces sparsogenes TaxID=67365 RepID=UPI0033F6DFB3